MDKGVVDKGVVEPFSTGAAAAASLVKGFKGVWKRISDASLAPKALFLSVVPLAEVKKDTHFAGPRDGVSTTPSFILRSINARAVSGMR